MSIFNVNPDPDYPVLNGPGFIQYTYQNPVYANAGAQQFYYNGQSVAPSGYQQQPQQPMMGFQMESRRYDAPAPTLQQQAQPQQYGFNQLVESRRTQGAVNPWASQSVQQPTQQFAQPQSFAQFQAPVQPMTYPVECSALCTCHPSFDRKNAWGDQPVYNPTPAPVVNWNGVSAQPMNNGPQYNYNSAPTMSYPVQPMTQAVQPSWEEIAKQNFGNK